MKDKDFDPSKDKLEVGQQIENVCFPKDPNAWGYTKPISGTVEMVKELQDTGMAKIRLKDGTTRLVCLG